MRNTPCRTSARMCFNEHMQHTLYSLHSEHHTIAHAIIQSCMHVSTAVYAAPPHAYAAQTPSAMPPFWNFISRCTQPYDHNQRQMPLIQAATASWSGHQALPMHSASIATSHIAYSSILLCIQCCCPNVRPSGIIAASPASQLLRHNPLCSSSQAASCKMAALPQQTRWNRSAAQFAFPLVSSHMSPVVSLHFTSRLHL
jgi:hypothetical protein